MKWNVAALAALVFSANVFIWNQGRTGQKQFVLHVTPPTNPEPAPAQGVLDSAPAPTRYSAAVQISNITAPQFQTLAADRVMLRNGKTLEGEVVGEDGSTLTLEILVPPGYTIKRVVNKAEIASRARPPHNGAPYILIPVIGEIGNDVTIEAIRAGLEKARAAHPSYIVLAIDSPGGDIGQMNGIVDLLIDASKDVKIVAYVKQAYSAAAVIAMCCNEVYMKPDAVIGAAVPFTMTENGPADVDAKFRSAFEAKIRASTARGGHADLLIRGMSETDLQIFLTTENGKPVLQTFGPGKLIKSSGQILTLTADEAVRCGLAQVSTGMTDLGSHVAGGPWYESSDRAWNAVIATVALARQHDKDVQEQRQRHNARDSAIARIRPECAAMARRGNELFAKSGAAQKAINELIGRGKAELQQIDFEYQQAVGQAQYQADPNAAIARAIEVHNARAAATRQYLDANIASLRGEQEAARLELAQLDARAKQLLASIPSE